MCIKSICNLISSFANINQTQQQDDKTDVKKCCKKPPEKPCYENDMTNQSIQYEFARIAISRT